jgi:hypothetical protein
MEKYIPWILGAAVMLLLFAFFIAPALGKSKNKQELLSNASLSPNVPMLIDHNEPAVSVTSSSDPEVTKLSYCTTYWTVPKEKNPNGGWDSIDGFWDAVDPNRWNETWQSVYE